MRKSVLTPDVLVNLVGFNKCYINSDVFSWREMVSEATLLDQLLSVQVSSFHTALLQVTFFYSMRKKIFIESINYSRYSLIKFYKRPEFGRNHFT